MAVFPKPWSTPKKKNISQIPTVGHFIPHLAIASKLSYKEGLANCHHQKEPEET